jgi:Kelch motif
MRLTTRRRFAQASAALACSGIPRFAAAATPPPGSWTTRASLPVACSEDGVAAAGNILYVAGGYVPAGAHPKVLEASGHADVDGALVQAYDVATDKWSTRASLPTGLNHIGITSFGGKLYTFGGFGFQNRGAVADANVYDPAADRWSPIAPLPAKLGSVSVAVLDGKIHLVGGRDAHSVTRHDVYDPATDRYATAAPLPVGRDHMGLAGAAGKLYAIAGRIDDFDHNTSYVDAYDPVADRWTVMKPMPSRRSGMAVALYRDMIFAIGGERRGGTFTNNEAYDPRSDTWTSFAPLPQGRHGTGAAVIGESLFLPAGAPVNGGSAQSASLLVFSLARGL